MVLTYRCMQRVEADKENQALTHTNHVIPMHAPVPIELVLSIAFVTEHLFCNAFVKLTKQFPRLMFPLYRLLPCLPYNRGTYCHHNTLLFPLFIIHNHHLNKKKREKNSNLSWTLLHCPLDNYKSKLRFQVCGAQNFWASLHYWNPISFEWRPKMGI